VQDLKLSHICPHFITSINYELKPVVYHWYCLSRDLV
jgi:hypothetical protein